MDDQTQAQFRDAGALAVALVTELFHRGDQPSTFSDLLAQHDEPRAVVTALAGLAVALLRTLDARSPGSAEEFLASAGLMVENMRLPPDAPSSQP